MWGSVKEFIPYRQGTSAGPDFQSQEARPAWVLDNLAGNAIDFFVRVLGLSLNDAMRQSTD